MYVPRPDIFPNYPIGNLQMTSLRLKQQLLYSHMRTISFKHTSPAGMKKHLPKINP